MKQTHLREFYRSVVTKWKLLITYKLSVFGPFPVHIYESWVTTASVLSEIQTAEMECLRIVHGGTLRNKVRSWEIRKVLNAETLFRIVKYQLRLPCNQNASRKIDETCTVGHTYDKAAQLSKKEQAALLHLRPYLVSAWCGASRTIYMGHFETTLGCCRHDSLKRQIGCEM